MSLYLMVPTFRGVVAVEGTAALVVGVTKVDAVATAAMVVEESKAAWIPVVAMEFVVVVDKVEDVMTVVHATAVLEWVKDCNQERMQRQVAALDHSQETRSHLGMCLSPLMQKIQNLNIFARILIALRQKNNLGTKAKEDLSAATVEVVSFNSQFLGLSSAT
ncbi:uncharacterized protein DS421_16g558220 [Arachis hypogaea]|nr:uncharacterized protein DS421_16g558220 [Arachis hypogaea]